MIYELIILRKISAEKNTTGICYSSAKEQLRRGKICGKLDRFGQQKNYFLKSH